MVLIYLIKGVFHKFFIINFLLYIKMSENTDLTYYQKNPRWLVSLNRAKDYYENDKERLREQARNKQRNLSEEEKIKKGNMGRIDIAKCQKIPKE